MVEHVARTLCRAAACSNREDAACPECDDINERTGTVQIGECMMWDLFKQEAEAAIEAVRDYARLDRRNKPRQRAPLEILQQGRMVR